jgi:hypothetical protein
MLQPATLNTNLDFVLTNREDAKDTKEEKKREEERREYKEFTSELELLY